MLHNCHHLYVIAVSRCNIERRTRQKIQTQSETHHQAERAGCDIADYLHRMGASGSLVIHIAVYTRYRKGEEEKKVA